jgi:hypothetical protein
VLFGFDYFQQPEQWRRSMQLFGTDVLPRIAHRSGEPA